MQLTQIDDLVRYMFAGHAMLTLVSLRTGTRFTYRIKKGKKDGIFFVDVLTGPNNEADYTPLGVLRLSPSPSSHYRPLQETPPPSGVAFVWFHKRVLCDRDATAWAHVEAYHHGFCARCRRRLTTPESIARGLGEKCAGLI